MSDTEAPALGWRVLDPNHAEVASGPVTVATLIVQED